MHSPFIAYSTSEESYTESNSEDYEPRQRRRRSCKKLENEDEDNDADDGLQVENDEALGNSCSLYENADMDKIHVTLECKDLWMKFHELGTEMIITKAGRSAAPLIPSVSLLLCCYDIDALIILNILRFLEFFTVWCIFFTKGA